MEDYKSVYKKWLECSKDKSVNESLKLMEGNDNLICDCFYKDLEFGTGGLRGKMGAGTNCLNYYTIVKATKGLADFMAEEKMSSAAITYDSRNNSEFFAKTAAEVLATCGITVHITDKCMPTPFLSFSVRRLNCDIGINITASHNPAEYNGYKVYGSDGCQLTDAACKKITGYIQAVSPFEVEVCCFEGLMLEGKINYISEKVAEDYLNAVMAESFSCAENISVAYSPLNGTGIRFVPEVFKRLNVSKVCIVESQKNPDGNFPTCPKPNPELDQTLSSVISLAKENFCDLALATDPDSDRIGVAVMDNDGGFTRLSGNEVGILILNYILERRGKSCAGGVIVKTIVTTPLAEKLAATYGVTTKNVLTGFKYIGEYIGKLESNGRKDDYVFGFEESCGYLKGSYVRDKDGVVASMLITEAAAYYKQVGKNLLEVLDEIYLRYGYYYSGLFVWRFEGASGAETKKRILENLRKNGPEEICGEKIISVKDYLVQSDDGLPVSDVLSYVAADGSTLIIRPSGTEPLIKAYVTVVTTKNDRHKLDMIKAKLDATFS